MKNLFKFNRVFSVLLLLSMAMPASAIRFGEYEFFCGETGKLVSTAADRASFEASVAAQVAAEQAAQAAARAVADKAAQVAAEQAAQAAVKATEAADLAAFMAREQAASDAAGLEAFMEREKAASDAAQPFSTRASAYVSDKFSKACDTVSGFAAAHPTATKATAVVVGAAVICGIAYQLRKKYVSEDGKATVAKMQEAVAAEEAKKAEKAAQRLSLDKQLAKEAADKKAAEIAADKAVKPYTVRGHFSAILKGESYKAQRDAMPATTPVTPVDAAKTTETPAQAPVVTESAPQVAAPAPTPAPAVKPTIAVPTTRYNSLSARTSHMVWGTWAMPNNRNEYITLIQKYRENNDLGALKAISEGFNANGNRSAIIILLGTNFTPDTKVPTYEGVQAELAKLLAAPAAK